MHSSSCHFIDPWFEFFFFYGFRFGLDGFLVMWL